MTSSIDPSAFIATGAVVVGDVTLGAEASVWYQAVVRGDMEPIVIGERSNIQDGCVVHVDEGLPCTVGRRVVVGHRVILHGCTVEDDCLIGMGSVVLNGATIGAGSLVAAGAVVPEGMTVPPGSVVMGVPGRIVRQVDDQTARRMAEGWKHYVELARAHAGGEFRRLRSEE
jgi:carbonic anhydrase/acetyltransferase-like protein (isoleucine patch superfamily)